MVGFSVRSAGVGGVKFVMSLAESFGVLVVAGRLRRSTWDKDTNGNHPGINVATGAMFDM